MAQKKFAVIGAGQFGQAISLALSEKGFEVLVIDKDMKKVQNISDDVAYAVCTDATDKRALLNENIKDFDAVIVAIGDDFVERLLCISNLIDLGIEKIYSRIKGTHQQTILEKMGITEFLSPEEELATNLAERLSNPNILSYLQMPDEYQLPRQPPPQLGNDTP